MAGFRKIVVGDGALASRYFRTAEKMLDRLESTGQRKKTATFQDMLIIVSSVNGVRKAIFISGILFIYVSRVYEDTTDPLNVRDIVEISGYACTQTRVVGTVDVTALALPAGVVPKIADFVGANSYLTIHDPLPYTQPAYRQYPLTASGYSVTVGVELPLNYTTPPFPFREIWRGVDRDYLYTADTLFVGSHPTAAIYERLWSDPTLALTLLIGLPGIPSLLVPTSDLNWPPITGPSALSTYWAVLGNDIYISGTLGLDINEYVEVWRVDRVAPAFVFEYVFVSWYAGGSSLRRFEYYMRDYFGTKIGFSSSEWLDVDGEPSDLQLVHSIEASDGWGAVETPLFTFNAGDYFGYSGRTTESNHRFSYTWRLAEDTYAVLITNQDSITGTNELPDGIILRTVMDEVEVIEAAYQAPEGYRLIINTIDQLAPSFVVCGQEKRDGTDQSVILINVLTKKVNVVETGTIQLDDVTFIR